MKKNERNLKICTVIFCTALVISNVVAGRIIPLPFGLSVVGAVLIYPITFLMTDIVGEVWGKNEANEIVKYGLIAQIFATALIVVTGMLPCVDPEADSAYKMLLGQNWVFVIGSLIGYSASQRWDVFSFHKIRGKYIEKHGTTKGGKWLWNNGSTIVSQLIDTAIYVTIAFGIGLGWLWNDPQALLNLAVGQYLVKAFLALCDTPFFYFFTRERK